MKKLNLAGKRFGRLVAIREIGRNNQRQILWLCQCDCGGSSITVAALLNNGHTKSCGCHRIDQIKFKNTKHGHSGNNLSPEYVSYNSMKERCINNKNKFYYRYGGRGIKVCKRWLGENGFANFLKDMGERPSPHHSLDRYPNNDGNYTPFNCRWATRAEQQRNKSSCIIIEYNGIKQTAAEWARQLSIKSKSTIYALLKRGRPFEWIYKKYKK